MLRGQMKIKLFSSLPFLDNDKTDEHYQAKGANADDVRDHYGCVAVHSEKTPELLHTAGPFIRD